MEVRKVELMRYYACDGREFDNYFECVAYEDAKRIELDAEIRERLTKITTLREEVNEHRLRFSVANCDAIVALNDGNKIIFHIKMLEYYRSKIDYNIHKSNLYVERRCFNELLDKAYLWFGNRKHKSMYAKKERRQKSLRWRQENTPDKWRTPNKIRVSKKEDNNE